MTMCWYGFRRATPSGERQTCPRPSAGGASSAADEQTAQRIRDRADVARLAYRALVEGNAEQISLTTQTKYGKVETKAIFGVGVLFDVDEGAYSGRGSVTYVMGDGRFADGGIRTSPNFLSVRAGLLSNHDYVDSSTGMKQKYLRVDGRRLASARLRVDEGPVGNRYWSYDKAAFEAYAADCVARLLARPYT